MACNSCGETCGCEKPGPKHCIEKKLCSHKEPCSCEQQPKGQIDARDVFYKLESNCNAFSNLDSLGIPKGADLEHILERMGRYIATFNYFDVTGNIYDATDFNSYMKFLQEDISELHLKITNFTEALENNIIKFNVINDRLDKLEKPEILDTRGLGFTINDNIFKILQIIATHG